MAAVSDASHTDLDIGVALPFHHAPHEVVLGDQALGLHQMDSQHSLWSRDRLVVPSWLALISQSGSSFTSVANSGSGEVCCGRVGGALPGPEELRVFRLEGKTL